MFDGAAASLPAWGFSLSCLYYKCMGMIVGQCVDFFFFWQFCDLAKLAIFHPPKMIIIIINWLYTRYESLKN
jgi:hypothetical protein